MSLGVVVKGPEGVVLAADSRVTLEARSSVTGAAPLLVTFDNASKLLSFGEPHSYVGAVTYGTAVLNLRTAHSFLPELQDWLPKKRVDVETFAKSLSDFFLEQWKSAGAKDTTPMSFVVAGYDPGAAYGSVYMFDIPSQPTPRERNPGNEFGMTWGGQIEFITRLIRGYDLAVIPLLADKLKQSQAEVHKLLESCAPMLEFRVPYQVLPLQDCVDLATFLIRTTVTAQTLSVGVRGVGGPIEVAYIRRTHPLKFIQRKRLRGEPGAAEGTGDEKWQDELNPLA